MEINGRGQKQVKRYKEIELDLRMRLTAKIMRNADQVEGRGDGEGMDEYLSSGPDPLTYQASARRNQEE